jgi:AraC-like DNA-binding protein
MISYSFRQDDYENWLAGFAATIDSTITNNRLSLPPQVGEGTIHAYNMTAQLSCLIMNFRSETDLDLSRETGGRQGLSLAFNQVVTMDGKKVFRSDIFLSDTRESLSVRIPAGSTVRRLILFYSDEMIRQFLPEELTAQLEAFAREGSASANKYFISLPYRETLKEIFDLDENDPLCRVTRLGHMIRLTEKFLHSFLYQERNPIPRTVKKNDLDSMRHIEQILSSRLEGFPSLESLAHEVFMSTSKLKTLFKQVYGYTLYDYYNKSRLQRAKEMLVTGQYSIKQTGCEIGFSNLSHFAKAFKKEYGVLPRDMVRNG